MCVFCEIIKGNIPSKKIYEDEKILAILDISQTTKGHTLVIPKQHYDNMLEMPKNEYGYLMETTHSIAKNIINKTKAEGMNLLINTNEISGQTVMHTHVHIIPRYTSDDTIKIEFKENKYNLDDVLKEIVD